MTEGRDGKNGGGPPDLLASLPNEGPACGIDPAAFEQLLTGVRDLREQVAGLREAGAADRPAPVPAAVPEALKLEALEAWGDKLVARVAEAARTADAPGDDAAATRIKRIEDAAAKAAAAAERIDGGLEGTADRVTAEIGAAATRIEAGIRITHDHVTQQAHLAHGALECQSALKKAPLLEWALPRRSTQHTWALELGADGITVNCICPGPTATELYVEANPSDSPRTKASLAAIPVDRIGTPEDMAHAIAFFLDSESAFVSGQALMGGGGSSLGARESHAPA